MKILETKHESTNDFTPNGQNTSLDFSCLSRTNKQTDKRFPFYTFLSFSRPKTENRKPKHVLPVLRKGVGIGEVKVNSNQLVDNHNDPRETLTPDP